MLVGGALVNALAFSGTNHLFTILKNSGVAEERKRHDTAVEHLRPRRQNGPENVLSA